MSVIMPRQPHAAIRSWMPHIVHCYFDREPFSLLETCQQIGRLLACLATSQDQLTEVIYVFDCLVDQGYLSKQDGEMVYYWGIQFRNVLYTPVQPKFDELVRQVTEQHPSSEQIKNQVVVNVTINNKVSWLNFEKIFDKLLGIDVKLF